MSILTRKIAWALLVLTLSACAYSPSQYGYSGYSSGSYDPDPYYSGYGRYQQNQQYYPRQPAPGYWGKGRTYGGNRSNNYYNQNNHYYGGPQFPNYPPQGYGYYNGRPYNPPWDNDHHPQNWGGWRGRYNQPYPNQPPPVLDNRDPRRFNPGQRGNRRNNAWQWDDDNRQRNWGEGQRRNNQPPQNPPQPMMGNRNSGRFDQGRRDERPDNAWQRENNNRQRNWGGGQDRKNSEQARQLPVNPPSDRYRPPPQPSQGNRGWIHNQMENNYKNRENRGGWQNQGYRPQPRLQFPQGQNNQTRNENQPAMNERMRQRQGQPGQNENDERRKRRRQMQD